MIVPTCTACKKAIPTGDVNVGADVAYCRSCNISHSLSSLTNDLQPDPGIDLTNPPPGAWNTGDGSTTTMGATHRSLTGVITTLFVALFWNGIVSVFVLFAVSATLSQFKISLPTWFPAPVMNNQDMSVGMTIFLWIFLLPFILIGLAMVGAFVSFISGKTEIRLTYEKGSIFTGIGKIGWTKSFTPSDVKRVHIVEQRPSSDSTSKGRSYQIVIDTTQGKQVRFGGSLTNERRMFLAAALQRALVR